jgi:hypothetical protein
MLDLRRRQFITLLGGAASWPVAPRAQQPDGVRRLGILISGGEADPEMQARVAAIRQRLDNYGWSEGRNLRIDLRFGEGDPDRYSSLSKALVALQPDAIIAYSTPVAAALRRESRTIPIVFVNVSDPVGSGLVASLARPGGNLTGLMLYEEGITGKWLAMLKEIAPQLSRAALIANPKSTPYDYFVRAAKATASSLAVEVVPSPIENAATSSASSSRSRICRTGARSYCRIRHPSCTATLSSCLPPGTACRRSTRSGSLLRLAASCPTAPTSWSNTEKPLPMSTVSSAVSIPPSFPCRRPPNTKPSST